MCYFSAFFFCSMSMSAHFQNTLFSLRGRFLLLIRPQGETLFLLHSLMQHLSPIFYDRFVSNFTCNCLIFFSICSHKSVKKINLKIFFPIKDSLNQKSTEIKLTMNIHVRFVRWFSRFSWFLILFLTFAPPQKTIKVFLIQHVFVTRRKHSETLRLTYFSTLCFS